MDKKFRILHLVLAVGGALSLSARDGCAQSVSGGEPGGGFEAVSQVIGEQSDTESDWTPPVDINGCIEPLALDPNFLETVKDKAEQELNNQIERAKSLCKDLKEGQKGYFYGDSQSAIYSDGRVQVFQHQCVLEYLVVYGKNLQPTCWEGCPEGKVKVTKLELLRYKRDFRAIGRDPLPPPPEPPFQIRLGAGDGFVQPNHSTPTEFAELAQATTTTELIEILGFPRVAQCPDGWFSTVCKVLSGGKTKSWYGYSGIALKDLIGKPNPECTSAFYVGEEGSCEIPWPNFAAIDDPLRFRIEYPKDEGGSLLLCNGSIQQGLTSDEEVPNYYDAQVKMP